MDDKTFQDELARRKAAGTMPSAAPVQAMMPPAQPVQPAPMATGWAQPAPMMPAPTGQPSGLLVPIVIPTPQGEATCYLQFSAEAASNPQALIAGLMQQGWPVKAYQPRSQGGGGFGGGGFNRGGGWNRGYR